MLSYYYCHSKSCSHRNNDDTLSEENLKAIYKDINLKKCGKCSSSFYCSSECQIYDWQNGHKKKCKMIIEHREAIYNDPTVTNGAVPGSTFQPNFHSPARSVEPYVMKQYNPNDGHKVCSITKSRKTLNKKFTEDQKTTFELMNILIIKVIHSDKWDRVEKGLPPRSNDYIYQFGVDMITNADDQELFELWNPQVLQFKSWCYRSSIEKRLFEFPNDTAAQLSRINNLLKTLIEWEPKAPNYRFPVFAKTLAVIASSLANNRFYLLQILNSELPLNKYVDILVNWSNRNDLPSDHEWNFLIELMINGLFLGIELSARHFDPIDPSLLVIFKPVCEKLIEVMSHRRNLQPFKYTKNDDVMLTVNKFVAWNADVCGGKSLRTIHKALKYNICSHLDISSIRFLWQWQQNQFNKLFKKYPLVRLCLSEPVEVLDELESFYESNNNNNNI